MAESGKYYRKSCFGQNGDASYAFHTSYIVNSTISPLEEVSQAATSIHTHPHKHTHTQGLLSYLCGQSKRVVCTGTEAQWCWSEFRNGCVVKAIDARLLRGFMAGQRSHAVPPNQSTLTPLHLLDRQRKKNPRDKSGSRLNLVCACVRFCVQVMCLPQVCPGVCSLLQCLTR